jgi:serine phosphatase RsbU (regulator of sigma subunit)
MAGINPSSIALWARSASTRHALVLLLAGTAYVVGVAYHMVGVAKPEPGNIMQAAYHVVVLICYVLLYLYLSERFRKRPASSVRVFWTPLFAGFILIGVAYFVGRFGRPSDLDLAPTAALGLDYETGRPLTLATVFKVNILSLAQGAFAFLLLLGFRDLILVKRTKISQRNWYIMLGFMVLASLLTFMKDPRAELNLLQRLAIVPAVGFMVLNSLRLSWIVYLTFREKMMSIGLSLLLALVLMTIIGLTDEALLGDSIGMPENFTFLRFYSYPLSVFISLVLIFGVLYCVTAFLSLLFHLPTTSDFQQKAGEVAAMHSLTTLVSQVFNPDRLYSSIAASPVDAGAAHGAWLAVADTRSGSLKPRIVAVHRLPEDRLGEMVDYASLYNEVSASSQPLMLDQAAADRRINVRPGDGLGSLLVIPLIARSDTLGALFVTKEVSRGFEVDDVEAISVFAAQAALALDNARLFEERLEKERLERELAIAREVQQKLLPQRLPTIPGLSVAASSVPAQEVGGDYFDFIELDDHRTGFIVADVSGKGTSAAFYMAELQGIFKSVSRMVSSPSAFLEHANAAIGRALERNAFISVIYGIIDVRLEKIVIGRAGHCPAATIDLAGNSRFLRSQGMGLGLDRGELFSKSLVEETLDLNPGDVLVLYTDGVVESRNSTGDEYGYDRLLRVLCENRHEEAHDLHGVLLSDLQVFLGGRAYEDDMTVVVMKWKGVAMPGVHVAETVTAASELN